MPPASIVVHQCRRAQEFGRADAASTCRQGPFSPACGHPPDVGRADAVHVVGRRVSRVGQPLVLDGLVEVDRTGTGVNLGVAASCSSVIGTSEAPKCPVS